jgi:tRNA threonylcarbamoyl adenosine modification protein YeaZ
LILLAIDTSTEMASLALSDDNKLLAEMTWLCGQNHTTELLPQLSYLLSKTKINIEKIEGIVVAKGPGSFNGLRVGISTAKGLAFSLGIPITGISTLETTAYQHSMSGLPVCPIHNAGRNEIASAIYQKKRGNWEQLVPEGITTLDKLLAGITTKTIFCGEYIPAIAEIIISRIKTKAIIPPYAALIRRAQFLAELGQKQFQNGLYDNNDTLQPLYLRRPPITERKHQ